MENFLQLFCKINTKGFSTLQKEKLKYLHLPIYFENNSTMPRAKTYKQKEYEIQQYYKQKRYNLKKSIELKHGKKIDSEYNRRVRTLDRNEENKLHNLKIKMWEARGNAKVRKRKTKKTPYSYACDLIQLYARLRDSDKDGSGVCIRCCKTYTRKQHQWWHWRPKQESRYTALLEENVNLECAWCNVDYDWLNVSDQEPNMIIKYWQELVDQLREYAKATPPMQSKPEIRIRELLPKVKSLLDEKTFDCSSYYKTLAILEGKFM